jgi:two-component system, NtrC family, sensor kinase
MARDKKGLGKKLKSPHRKAAPSSRSSEASSRPARGRSGKSQQTRVTKLARELGDALQRQSATAEILKVIASSRSDVQPVFEAIAASANQLIGGFSTAVYRFVDGMAHLAAFTPTTPAADEILKRAFPRQTTDLPQFDRVQAGKVLEIPNIEETYEEELRQIARARGFRSMLGVPLVNNGTVIGLITVTRAETGLFTDHHLQLLQTFADQAVIAIENVRLFNETEEALERQTATADILKVIASSPSDVQPVFDAIAERSKRLVDALSTTVFRLVDGMMHLRAFTPTTPEADATLQAMFPAPLSTFSWGESIRSGEIYRVNDTEHEPEGLRDLARLRGWRSCLCVPLLRDGKPIGMIGPTRVEPGPFADHHVQLLQTFADQAVIAISNVELFQQVQERTRELSASLDDLRATQDRLVQTEKLASLGQLTAGIAHEIKNPLNFVNNFSTLSTELIEEMKDVLSDISLDNNKREELDQITKMLKDNLEKVVLHGKRADSIVKNMLQHSRQGSSEHRVVDINAIVDESLNLAYHGARAEKEGFSITLQRDLDPSVGMADVYPQEITRALLNLVSNAFYATTKRKAEAGDGFEPVLYATTKNLGGKVEIRIRDNGTGIPEEVKEKIFNPFFTTKPAGEGTGLGLSMSHDIIVKQHGGSIDVESEPGLFTEFKIVLPRTSQR